MSADKTLFSPKQVAQALATSESSVKRWCDQGKIKFLRSAGGHRRIESAAVLDFVRSTGQQMIAPRMIGLESCAVLSDEISHIIPLAVEILLQGDEEKFSDFLTGLYFAKFSLPDIFDLIVAPAFHQIGAKWECEDAEIYQERRSCEICTRSLAVLRKLQSEPTGKRTAIGGTLSGDIYQLPVSCAELVLRDLNIKATLLGTSIPGRSFCAAIDQMKPDLVWLSVSFIANEAEFIREFDSVSKCCRDHHVALVIGGQALTSELRKQLSYSAFCDTMKHLETFVKST